MKEDLGTTTSSILSNQPTGDQRVVDAVMTERSKPTLGSYRISKYDDFATITCFGSDEDTLRKGWRSLGCQSVSLADLPASIAALERNGRTRETRTDAEMSIRALAALAQGGAA